MARQEREATGGPLDVGQILALLPQRYPFVMVDRVISFEMGRRLEGMKNISAGDSQIPGHFPGRPVFPGALLLEGVAQCCILLFVLTYGRLAEGEVAIFGSAAARFLRMVQPGDIVRFEVEAVKMTSFAGVFKGRALVDGEVAARCDLTMGKQKEGGGVF
jgi:3-hydroxyacyl-[acyl-carrier-protein] dehydratase